MRPFSEITKRYFYKQPFRHGCAMPSPPPRGGLGSCSPPCVKGDVGCADRGIVQLITTPPSAIADTSPYTGEAEMKRPLVERSKASPGHCPQDFIGRAPGGK